MPPIKLILFYLIINLLIISIQSDGLIYEMTLVTPIAGQPSKSGDSGDGGQAISALFSFPHSLAYANGNIYIADANAHKIRKIDSKGLITTIAGNGNGGYSGDGVIATSSQLYFPRGVSVDASTNDVYIADSYNNRIRKVSNGIISTIAGSGVSGYSGDGGDATKAQLDTPYSVAFSNSSGLVYILDTNNYKVRIIKNSSIISYIGDKRGFGGDGQLASSQTLIDISYGISISSKDYLLITDTFNGAIRLVKDNMVSTVIGDGSGSFSFAGDGGLATSAKINRAHASVMTSDGTIYLADTDNSRIRIVFPDSQTVHTLIGSDGKGIYKDGSSVTLQSAYGITLIDDYQFLFIDGNSIKKAQRLTCKEDGTPSPCFPLCYGIFPYDKLVCSGSGSCIGYNNCNCSDSNRLGGLECNIPVCSGILASNTSVCNGRGQCNSPNNCICNVNYQGSNCELTTCYGILNSATSVCSGRGKCSDFNTCECRPGYYGDNCEKFNCFGVNYSNSSVCSGNGNCTNIDTCQCISNFTGNSCQYPQCNSIPSNDQSVCNFRNGTCINVNTCICNSNFIGSNCEIPLCYGKSKTDACNGKGQCISPNKCICDPYYYGSQCELFDCFGISNRNSSVCYASGFCSSPNQCTCHLDYYGIQCNQFNCFGINKNELTVCSSHGTCIDKNSCYCNEGYYGIHCNITYCNGKESNSSVVCNGKGKCQSLNNCQCQIGYFGNDCQLTFCNEIPQNNSNVCSSHGSCIELNTCHCNSNYTGKNCEIPLCYGISSIDPQVCNQGKCLEPNTCICKEGWIGKNCTIPYCIGTLESINNTFKCGGGNNGQFETRELIYSVGELDKNVTFNKFGSSITVNIPSAVKDYLMNEQGLNSSEIVRLISSVTSQTNSNDEVFAVSSVVTISIYNNNDQKIPIMNLDQPIELAFSNLSTVKDTNALFNFTCMFFDESDKIWKTDGIETIINDLKFSLTSNIVTFSMICKTSHLTSFAVIDQNYKKANTKGREPEPSDLNMLKDDTLLIAVVVSSVGGGIVLCVIIILMVVIISLFIKFRMKKSKNISIE